MRGDLIEAFKIIRGFVNYGQNLFKLSRSNLNILSNANKKTSLARRDFFSERVVNYWNILPNIVKLSPSVNSFKVRLENYKVNSLENKFHNSIGHFWELSDGVLGRIESPSYIAGRPAYCEYLCENPWVAKYKQVNIYKYNTKSS